MNGETKWNNASILLYNRCNFCTKYCSKNNSITITPKKKNIFINNFCRGGLSSLVLPFAKKKKMLCHLQASVLKQLCILLCHKLPPNRLGSVIFPQLEGSSFLNWSQICKTSFSCILPISFSLKITYSDLLKTKASRDEE